MRPKFFRDPLHLQIRFEPVDKFRNPSKQADDAQISWALQNIIDSEPFQRLRHIRQNGLTNMVFHGAEHSRFSHSMGVSYLAREMFEKLSRNSSIEQDFERKRNTAIAALIHDVGHGPFSHAMEEILKNTGSTFHHEDMTLRFIRDHDSSINRVLRQIDEHLPNDVALYFDKKARGDEDHWVYKIVSSQMDADRLDYIQRDSLFAGIKGTEFDVERLLDLMFVSGDVNIAVDRGAIEALEAYLIALDQVWRAVYYHQAVRSASKMLVSLFRRAFYLYKNGDKELFQNIRSDPHPMAMLFEHGSSVELGVYLKLTDSVCWAMLDAWRGHKDIVISDLSDRLFKRKLLKTIEIDPAKMNEGWQIRERAREETLKQVGGDADLLDYYLMYDDASRTSYKTYDWKPDAPNDSIWLTGGGRDDRPVEADDQSGLIVALRNTRHFDRLVMLESVRDTIRA